MRSDATLTDAGIIARTGASARPPTHVMVLFESTPSGVAALQEAAELADEDADLSVVTLAPQGVDSRCCSRGPSAEVVNCVVRDAAEEALGEARRILGDTGKRTTFKSLVGNREPPLTKWAAANAFDLIVLPARRLSIGGHPLARKLRRATTAEVRLIGRANRPVGKR
ncbi:MAG: universal stress protein [Solirubrobacteraceae bacterium]